MNLFIWIVGLITLLSIAFFFAYYIALGIYKWAVHRIDMLHGPVLDLTSFNWGFMGVRIGSHQYEYFKEYQDSNCKPSWRFNLLGYLFVPCIPRFINRLIYGKVSVK